jgi:hypothetical protein
MGTPLRGLFGRDREIDEADVALDAAASAEPRVLLVGGDAGIGKTSLVGVVADHARSLDFRVLVGHCLDIDDGVALRPVREALRQAVAGRSPRPGGRSSTDSGNRRGPARGGTDSKGPLPGWGPFVLATCLRAADNSVTQPGPRRHTEAPR